jgi:HPt (histidine-containing phosphotransfer) domain-containing protein
LVFVPDVMMRNLSGHRAIAIAMLESLLIDLPERVAGLSAALADGDLGVSQLEAHTIKGLGGNGGAPLLSELALRAEDHCREGRLAEARQQLDALRIEAGRVLDEWRAFLGSPG